jgi:hypothetical protein
MNREAHQQFLDSWQFLPRYGPHRWTLGSNVTVNGISARTWDDFLSFLAFLPPGQEIVVSPELMTMAGHRPSHVQDLTDVIAQRVDSVAQTSARHPEKTFLLGTPTFHSQGKPKNSVISVREGAVIGVTHKRTGASAEEKEYFDFQPDTSPAIVPDTDIGILICADLPTATIFLSEKTPYHNELLRLSGREHFIGSNPTFIHPDARRMLLVSCWGTGGREAGISHHPGGADEYYKWQLINCVLRLLSSTPSIEELVVVDRVPSAAYQENHHLTPSAPYNAYVPNPWSVHQTDSLVR